MKHTDYPALYQSASALSKSKQDAFYRTFLAHMVLLAVASAISVVNSQCPEVAILQALVLLGALGCAGYLYLGRPDRHWYSSRAVAESIKTITWRYVSRAEPFDHSDDADRQKFLENLKAIVDQNKDVAGLLTSNLAGVQISAEMDNRRQALLAQRIAYYKDHRIIEQQKWYADKAGKNERMVTIFFRILLLTIVTSIFFAIAKVRHPTAPYWPTDFFVTAAAGFLSWIQARRFQELSISYALTAHEISLIREESTSEMNDDDFSKFVGDTENAFSREHTQWAARKDH